MLINKIKQLEISQLLEILNKEEGEEVLYLIISYFLKKDNESEVDFYFKKLKTISTEKSSYLVLTEILIEYYNTVNIEIAINKIEKKYDNNNPWMAFEYAYLLFQDFKDEEALEELEKINIKYDGFLMAIFLHAEILIGIKEYKKSLEILNKISFEDEITLNLKGVSLYSLGDHKEGLSLIEKSIEFKKNPKAFYSLGYIYSYDLFEYEKALSCFKSCVELEPDNIHYLMELGWSYFENKDIENAKLCFSNLLKLNLDEACFNSIMMFYFCIGEFEKVKELISKKLIIYSTTYIDIGFEILIKNKKIFDDKFELADELLRFETKYGADAYIWFEETIERIVSIKTW